MAGQYPFKVGAVVRVIYRMGDFHITDNLAGMKGVIVDIQPMEILANVLCEDGAHRLFYISALEPIG